MQIAETIETRSGEPAPHPSHWPLPRGPMEAQSNGSPSEGGV